MKKILLTLFAVAAVFVACDKDELGYDSSSINVLEQAEEINASIDYDYGSFLDQLADDAPAVSTKGKGTVSTARTGEEGTEWIHAIFFTLGNNELVHLAADTDAETCIPSTGVHASATGAISVLYTFRTVNGNGLLQIQIGNNPVINRQVANVAGYTNLFSGNLNYVRLANDQRSGTIAGTAPPASAFDFTCAADEVYEWGESPTVPGLFSNNDPAITTTYQLSAAPFPLSGILARTSDESVSANYAGSGDFSDSATWMAVRTAIQDDIEGN